MPKGTNVRSKARAGKMVTTTWGMDAHWPILIRRTLNLEMNVSNTSHEHRRALIYNSRVIFVVGNI